MRSQRGIAMIFAIVAFVVVMVLGTVVYTAGYANYSKLFGRNKSRQEYYILTSAAKLVAEELDGASVVETIEYQENEEGVYVLYSSAFGPASSGTWKDNAFLSATQATSPIAVNVKIEQDGKTQTVAVKATIKKINLLKDGIVMVQCEIDNGAENKNTKKVDIQFTLTSTTCGIYDDAADPKTRTDTTTYIIEKLETGAITWAKS